MTSNQVFVIAKSNYPTRWFLEKIKNDDIDLENCYLDIQTNIGKISEFAGRICYNSGYKNQKNRDSISYHKHIIESKHFSIYGHINFTISIDIDNIISLLFLQMNSYVQEEYNNLQFFNYLFEFLSKYKRIYLRYIFGILYVNISLRHIIEFFAENKADYLATVFIKTLLEKHEDLRKFLEILFPDKLSFVLNTQNNFQDFIKAVNDVFKWYSFYIYTSRRTANELIRHNTEYAISQQSTRYVFKNNLQIVDIRDYLYPNISDVRIDYFTSNLKEKYFTTTESLLKKIWEFLSKFIQDYGKKEILGYYANFLPNGIDTELVFSCTEWQFERIKEQRLTKYADKNIYDLVEKMNRFTDE